MNNLIFLVFGIATFSVSNIALSASSMALKGCTNDSLRSSWEARLDSRKYDLGYRCKFNLTRGVDLSPDIDFCTMSDGTKININWMQWSVKPNCSFKIQAEFGDGRVAVTATGKFQQSDLACGFGSAKVKDSINNARYTGTFKLQSAAKQCDSSY